MLGVYSVSNARILARVIGYIGCRVPRQDKHHRALDADPRTDTVYFLHCLTDRDSISEFISTCDTMFLNF